LQEEAWRIDQLHLRIRQFRTGAQQRGIVLPESHTAIQPLIVGASETALQLSDDLLQQNILVGAIRPPTVPANTARLRITISAAHTESDIEQLLDALHAALQSRKE